MFRSPRKLSLVKGVRKLWSCKLTILIFTTSLQIIKTEKEHSLRDLDSFLKSVKFLGNRQNRNLLHSNFQSRQPLPSFIVNFFLIEDTTSSCATAFSAYSGGKQRSLWDFPSRGINCRWKKSILLHKRLLDFAWFCLFPYFPWLPCSCNFYLTWFEAPNGTVVFDH